MIALSDWQNLSTAEQAERLLQERDFRFARCIRCFDSNDVLTLTGRVPTWHLKQLAQTIVAEIDEVTQIDNQISVFSNPGPALP